MSKTYYLTTPIYYVNAAPHIGHAYTTIAADAIRRLKRMQGYDAILTTGTDEHGQKVERAAKATGKTPQEFTDLISAEFRQQWKTLGLAIDRFKRTSEPSHHEVVQDLFLRCQKNGYIEKGSYTGQYCVYDELYVNDAGPGDPCPDCGRPTETVTEENFFFKLSRFRDRLLDFYAKNPDFIRPETRRNEVLAFVERGLSDLSISRTTIKWGIPVPAEGKHVFYVWFDALSTYMSAVAGENRWPADLHLIGKEILRFHAIYWPAFLMAADLPLPKQIFAHGWLLFEQDKMSKSRGNIVRATPIEQVVGVDGLRYFLLREIVFGQDGNFSYDALINRYNSDLANGLGNLASRTLTMIRQYREGAVPASKGNQEIAAQALQTIAAAVQAFSDLEFSKGLEVIWSLLGAVDRYIVAQAPWAKAAGRDETLYTAAEVLRIACILLYPVIPAATAKIWEQLGMREPLESVQLEGLAWGQLKPGQKIGTIAAVFPRIDAKPAIAKMRALEEQETARQAALMGKGAPQAEPAPASGIISIDEFAKVQMRVGLVLTAERVKGADKLLHMQVDVGEAEPRSIVAGIAEAYTPEELVGRRVVIVANLQPRKLRGIPSNGMVLAATPEGGKPVLVSVPGDVPPGTMLR
jgi:methionyl-tRNA synthetase